MRVLSVSALLQADAPASARSVRSRAVAAALCALAIVAYLTNQPASGASPARALPMLTLSLLAASYIALGIEELRASLRAALGGHVIGTVAGPAALWSGVVVYGALAGLPVRHLALVYGLYLAAPLLLILVAEHVARAARVLELSAVIILGLGIKYHLLPSLPLPPPDGFDASRLVGLLAGLYLVLVARAMPGVGFTWDVTPRDLALAALAFAVFAAVALPIGFATGFLLWHPQPSWSNAVLKPVTIFLVTAVPEEFLYRGVVQNVLVRWLGAAQGLVVAAVIFGVSHYPDPRYILLASLAGVAYGWVYLSTGKITASAVTHALVDTAWVVLLR